MAASSILSADARPTKRFFIENLTRDLSLEDAILDLVDNAVDSFIRTRDLDVSPALLTAHAKQTPVRVTITLSTEEFRIEDSCGGIDIEHARFNVFRFGRTSGSYGGYLGVYGIGLKRAVFKLGSNISITSRTATSGFEATLDADEWSDDEENWTFPLRETASARSLDEAGTTIVVRKLKPEVQMRVNDGALLKRLGDAISTNIRPFPTRVPRYHSERG